MRVAEYQGMRIALAVVSAAALLALAACSSDEPEVPQVSGSEASASVAGQSETPSEEPPPGPTNEDLRRFVELAVSGNPTDLERAKRMTAPESGARAVITVWHARYSAAQQAGYDLPEQDTVNGGDGAFEVCSKEPPCQTWNGFKAKGDLIADFAIDRERMRERVILGSKKKYEFGGLATARLIGSYRFVSDGSLGIYLEVTARADVTFGWDSDAYVGPNGAQVGIAEVTVPGTLRSGATAIIAYYLPTAELGGDLFLTAVEDGGAQRDEDATIHTG